jgi:Holliday junction resolvasome RuvABC endonuclease subunit
MESFSFIVGGDLSSSKLAFACRTPRKWLLKKYHLGTPFRPDSTAKALDATLEYLDLLDKVMPRQVERILYLENPVFGRGGARATMVQSFVSGVVQACFVKAGFKVYMVNVMTWKKTACGTGKATKEEVVKAVGQRWPEVISTISLDQDIADACGVLSYGYAVQRSRNRLANEGRL